jgi:organic hydroperoxide reductase OsmC/OhrA
MRYSCRIWLKNPSILQIYFGIMEKMKTHRYTVDVAWTGNRGAGTQTYAGYDRTYEVRSVGKATILGSSDPAFRGDPACWNPEDLFISTISACHKLWYLHFCAVSKVNVISYEDTAEGEMQEDGAEGGRFTRVTLRPRVVISDDSDPAVALALHDKAHHACFIANSLSIPVLAEPTIVAETATY